MWAVLLTIWLLVVSIVDFFRCRVPVWMLIAGMLLGAAAMAYSCFGGERKILDVAGAIIPGLMLLLVSFATKKAGYGDGAALLILGMSMKGEKVFLTFGISLFLIALCSAALLALKKVKQDTRLPYLPFLTAAWLLAGRG